ncbi:hypothetical protein FJTKL_08185 [Diaporthe vaccinii]|uniref:Uncharacterized protein n=1 Tax=Diaporthe vaccinii TaxID=105482 RepID=A0ABR4ESW9_9PEZI
MTSCFWTRPYQWPESYYQVPVSGTFPQSYARLPVSGTTQPQVIPTVYPQTYQYYQYLRPLQTMAYRQPQLWYQAYVN